MDVPVLVNAQAGSLKSSVPGLGLSVADWLDESAFVVRISAEDMSREAKRLVEAGHKRIAVLGGDGSINSVLKTFVEEGVELVALPGGTLNHFCRDLGVPLDPADWNTLLHSRCIRQVDVGVVNGCYFANNASIGLYPKLVRLRENLEGERLLGSKRLATAWAFMRLWTNTRKPLRLKWRVADLASSQTEGGMRTHAAVVSNNAYANEPMAPTSRPVLDDGRLTLYAPESLKLSLVVQLAEAALAGELDRCAGLVTLKGHAMTLELEKQQVRLSLDGELRTLDSPLVFEIRQHGLSAVIPDEH